MLGYLNIKNDNAKPTSGREATVDVSDMDQKLLRKVEERFHLKLHQRISFVHLRTRFLLEARCYPVFTLLGQAVGSLIVALETVYRLQARGIRPALFIDTMGYAFTYPIVKLFLPCKVLAYVHYPTISTDMLERVQQRSTAFNNRGIVSRSSLLTSLKVQYV